MRTIFEFSERLLCQFFDGKLSVSKIQFPTKEFSENILFVYLRHMRHMLKVNAEIKND